jgi:hypothetical protein
LSPQEYARWVENPDNDLKKVKMIGDYTITLQYKPVDYVIVMEEQKHQLPEDMVSQRRKTLEDLHYYSLRLESTDKQVRVMDIGNNTDQDYYDKISYFSYGMQEDISLVSGNDTLQCKLYHAERNYELTPYLDFVLAFENPDPANQQPIEFVLDGYRLGLGPVKFTLSPDDISNVPHLKTN